tara:strand:- start:5093 stop:5560 length:468 start_codon:yes stop_codon:yes gene_type:complete
MKITPRQLRQIIREELENLPKGIITKVHGKSPSASSSNELENFYNLDKTNITSDEAFSAGCSVCGKDPGQCDHNEYTGSSEEPGRDLGYGEGEGRMAKSQLYKVGEYAAILHDMLHDNDDLPEWVLSKIAVMSNDIGKIKHYIEYKILRMRETKP